MFKFHQGGNLSSPLQLVSVDVGSRRNTVARDLSLGLEAGSIVGIGGDNGVGKSTLLRTAAGLLAPLSGSVYVFAQQPMSKVSRSRTGAAIDTPAFYSWMGGMGFLQTMQNLAGYQSRTEAAQALNDFGLRSAGRKRIFRYSQGMKKRLSLAAASLGSPDLLLLDEPTNALDPDGQAMVWSWLRQERDNGRAILVVSHRDADAAQCDFWYRMTKTGLLQGG